MATFVVISVSPFSDYIEDEAVLISFPLVMKESIMFNAVLAEPFLLQGRLAPKFRRLGVHKPYLLLTGLLQSFLFVLL
jgi:hypothetical protein